jgi:hypothetical protein
MKAEKQTAVSNVIDIAKLNTKDDIKLAFSKIKEQSKAITKSNSYRFTINNVRRVKEFFTLDEYKLLFSNEIESIDENNTITIRDNQSEHKAVNDYIRALIVKDLEARKQ